MELHRPQSRSLCAVQNKCEEERERGWEGKEKARDIQNLAQQNGERMPDKREALAMVDSKEEQRVVARVSGNDHFEAVYALDNAVGVEHKKQRREEQHRHIS